MRALAGRHGLLQAAATDPRSVLWRDNQRDPQLGCCEVSGLTDQTSQAISDLLVKKPLRRGVVDRG
jgi:hypothetical protein